MSFRHFPISIIAGVSIVGLTCAVAVFLPKTGLVTAGSNAADVDANGLSTSVATLSASRFAPNYATDLVNLRRWQKNELTVYVANPDSAHNPTGRDYASSIIEGADLWTPYLHNVLTVRFVNDPADADIRISFVDRGTLPEGAIGRTEVTYRNRDNVIVGATMRIDRSLRDELLCQVASHEFGHAFGMEGHSIDKSDLMYARAHLPSTITERDSNTLHLNYSLQAPRPNAHPTLQIGGAPVSANLFGTHTATACSLPEDTAH